jgi:hypothetical protein
MSALATASRGSHAQPPVDQPERMRVQGTTPALVVVREELGAVGRHVDVRGALRLAGLAGQAQVERPLDRLVFPAVLHDLALKELEEQVRAAARAVLLLERHHVAGTHRPAVVFPALAQTDAPQRRPRDRPTSGNANECAAGVA